MTLDTFTFDRFYNGQEIQEKLGSKPLGKAAIGFNSALRGLDWAAAGEEHPCDWRDYAGYYFQAEKWIQEGKLYFKPNGYNGIAVKVIKDGNSFCCVGEGFVNLQESDNYSFGETFEESIKNYMEEHYEKND